MKYLRQLCAVVGLTVLFMVTASAGDMPGSIAAPQPPQPSATKAGDMPYTVAVDPVTEVALSLFQTVLSLF